MAIRVLRLDVFDAVGRRNGVFRLLAPDPELKSRHMVELEPVQLAELGIAVGAFAVLA